MSLFDKAKRYLHREGCLLYEDCIVDSDLDLLSADDPILPALVEYYEANEAFQDSEDTIERVEAYDRIHRARTILTGLENE